MQQRVDPNIRVSGEEPPSTEPSYSLEQYLQSNDQGVTERLMDGEVRADGIVARYDNLSDKLEELSRRIGGA
ncbi:hypothetical protein QBC39DRAFT_18176 [Podospora conica]|nr:hypothetical protein QBC39DRAFT_18176 [Schizothecium conicum]